MIIMSSLIISTVSYLLLQLPYGAKSDISNSRALQKFTDLIENMLVGICNCACHFCFFDENERHEV